ncbi:hypothetical protein H2200_008493 [Cladophialophora chaetospira]|uniref:Uncharacterized protein n=1 Tax=Cladophialophora chaetospira TaxID=386627 RepID=A0AA39CGI7_9EURO|nr:hypothetical protein H2200_008493 [Cladophialophora chaetospira]
MCYTGPFILLYQCDLCATILRASITPVHICRFGHVHNPSAASNPDSHQGLQPAADLENPNAFCDGTFTQMPATDTPPYTLTIKSHERCAECQARLGVDIMPGESEDEQEREMARMLLWSRWIDFIRDAEVGEYLTERAEWERMG